MSNALAIAAVTKTLLNLITHGVSEMPGQKVTALPPEKANVMLHYRTPSRVMMFTVPFEFRDLPLP